MSSVSHLKHKRRTELQERLNEQDILDLSKSVTSRLATFLFARLEGKAWVGSFMPLKNEPQIHALFENSFFRWCFPRVTGDRLEYFAATQFEKSQNLGMSEPLDGQRVEISQIPCLLVPGLGFDKKGYRLGRGLGFYDRVLESYSGLSVGVAFDCQIVDELDRDFWDRPVQILVTESQVYDFRKVA
jgi:5-formyltetrahydrofolate cyclo-ligase